MSLCLLFSNVSMLYSTPSNRNHHTQLQLTVAQYQLWIKHICTQTYVDFRLRIIYYTYESPMDHLHALTLNATCKMLHVALIANTKLCCAKWLELESADSLHNSDRERMTILSKSVQATTLKLKHWKSFHINKLYSCAPFLGHFLLPWPF